MDPHCHVPPASCQILRTGHDDQLQMDRRGRLDLGRGCINRYAQTEFTSEAYSVYEYQLDRGSVNWNAVSERLPGRNNKSCRKRWIHSLDPSLRKGSQKSTFLVTMLMSVQADGQRLKTHFLLQLCEGMVVTGIKLQSCYQVGPTTSAPSDGGRN